MRSGDVGGHSAFRSLSLFRTEQVVKKISTTVYIVLLHGTLDMRFFFYKTFLGTFSMTRNSSFQKCCKRKLIVQQKTFLTVSDHLFWERHKL